MNARNPALRQNFYSPRPGLGFTGITKMHRVFCWQARDVAKNIVPPRGPRWLPFRDHHGESDVFNMLTMGKPSGVMQR